MNSDNWLVADSEDDARYSANAEKRFMGSWWGVPPDQLVIEICHSFGQWSYRVTNKYTFRGEL